MAVEQRHIDELAAAKASLLQLEAKAQGIYEQSRVVGDDVSAAKRRYREALEAVGEAA